MNNFNKYFGLLALLFGGLVGFILLVIAIFYILKLCSVTLFYIPGFDHVFQYIIIIIPYIIFFSAYNYLRKKIPASTKIISRGIAYVLILLGSVICFTTLIISTLKFGGLRKAWINTFEENSHYALIIHIVLLIITAGVIATGDAKEKSWLDRTS